MAHPLALQLRNLQSLVEIGVDKNTTVVFPAPLMSTIGELGAFLAREKAAATRSAGAGHGGSAAAACRRRTGRSTPRSARPGRDRRQPRGLGRTGRPPVVSGRRRPPAGGGAGAACGQGVPRESSARGCHDASVTVTPPGGWPAEPRLLDAFDAAALVVDGGGQVVYANEAAERLYGHPVRPLVGDTMLRRLFSENEQVAFAVVIRQVLDGRPWKGRLGLRQPTAPCARPR